MKKLTLILLVFITSCDISEEEEAQSQIHVSVFLYENCPIAQYMTLPLNNAYEEFYSSNVSFTAYFPNILSSNESINNFRDKYSILFPCVDDQNGYFVELYQASVYSQVFVEKDGIIVYSGMIENSYSDLGQWSPADKYYLYDVLDALINDNEVPWESNTAIGCLI